MYLKVKVQLDRIWLSYCVGQYEGRVCSEIYQGYFGSENFSFFLELQSSSAAVLKIDLDLSRTIKSKDHVIYSRSLEEHQR